MPSLKGCKHNSCSGTQVSFWGVHWLTSFHHFLSLLIHIQMSWGCACQHQNLINQRGFYCSFCQNSCMGLLPSISSVSGMHWHWHGIFPLSLKLALHEWVKVFFHFLPSDHCFERRAMNDQENQKSDRNLHKKLPCIFKCWRPAVAPTHEAVLNYACI